MTDAEADAAQQWAGMDGATAFMLINRHADDWQEVDAMMEAWRRAAVADTARKCIAIVEGSKLNGIRSVLADEIRQAFK